MFSLCILYLHHSDDDLTRYHFEMIKRFNPSTPIVPLTFNLGLLNAVKLRIHLTANQSRSEWRNVDKLVYEWYRSGSRIEAERYLILESDTLCNMPVKEFYFQVWDSPVSGATINTPNSNPKWRPFAEVRDKQIGRLTLQGITPLCGILLSREALAIASAMSIESCYDGVYCELRMGTLLSTAGYLAKPILPEINQYISCFDRAPTGPGVWHKVKSKYPSRIHATGNSIAKTSLSFEQNPLTARIRKRRHPFVGFKFKKRHRLIVEQYSGYETRNESTIRMIDLAIKEYDIPDFDWKYVYTGNGEAPMLFEGTTLLRYATATESYENVCPDFTFDHWSQTQMDDYEKTRIEISQAGNDPPETNMLGWRGNIRTHKSREKLVSINDKNVFDTESTNWNRANPHRLTCDNFISLSNQVKKWRYLIDIESAGWSPRLKLLFFSKRVVFVQNRPFQEWYFPYLKPWEHFVPVKRDLSNLTENLNIIKSNPDLENKIRLSAFSFAEKYLTRDSAIRRWNQLLNLTHSIKA